MKYLLFLSTTLLSLASVVLADDAKVCFEAEKTPIIRFPFRKVASKTALGGGYLEITWDENKAKRVGSVTYKFNVKTPGTYYVWARTFWTPEQGNSIRVSVNEGDDKILGEDGTYNAWHWVGGRAHVTLKAGVNTLTLKYHEADVRIDQFCLSQSREYQTNGPRKATK